MQKIQKITPFLWFDTQAGEAADFYVSVFPNSRILATTRYSDKGPGPEGSIMTVVFELDGQEFTALNGGPVFRFNEAVSFVVNCETQEEIDSMWQKLTDGGKEVECGWLTDRYGLSWQVVPVALRQMLTDPDPTRSQRVMEAIMTMKKLDLATLEAAYESA